MKKFFHFEELGTSYKTETLAGVTTFMTMAYIIVVNPAILSNSFGAKMSFEAVMAATCIASAVATVIMALWANYPIALAPGMGLNAFFSFEICNMIAALQARHQVAAGVEPWKIALGMVFLSGCLFMVLTLLRIREMIINSVPNTLKHAIAAGIGLFIAFIGLEEAGVITADPNTLVQLGKLSEPATVLGIIGLAITLGLMAMRVRGSILIGLIATGLLGIPFGIVKFDGVVSVPPVPSAMFQLHVRDAFSVYFITPILMLFFFDTFDTIGTLIGVGQKGGLLVDGKLPRATQALTADAMGTIVGSLTGTSTTTSYIESAAGVAEGGRTGFASLVTAALFLVAMFFTPLVKMFGASVPSSLNPEIFLRPITAPALITVGFLMMSSIRHIDWDDVTEGGPAFLTVLTMPLTFSISHGFAIGFISFPLLKAAAGKAREVHWLVWVLMAIFIARYLFLPIHL